MVCSIKVDTYLLEAQLFEAYSTIAAIEFEKLPAGFFDSFINLVYDSITFGEPYNITTSGTFTVFIPVKLGERYGEALAAVRAGQFDLCTPIGFPASHDRLSA